MYRKTTNNLILYKVSGKFSIKSELCFLLSIEKYNLMVVVFGVIIVSLQKRNELNLLNSLKPTNQSKQNV